MDDETDPEMRKILLAFADDFREDRHVTKKMRMMADLMVLLVIPALAIAFWRGGWCWILPGFPMVAATALYAIARSIDRG